MTDQQQLSQNTINEFVIAAHSDLEKVQQMLADEPALLNENADWIETAIQGAAHVNNRAIIDYLLAQGAPIDICTAAVLGQRDEVAALLRDSPEMARATGPHNLPVMFYPALTGDTAIAEMLYNAGSPVNVEDGTSSPLHAAAGFGQAAMARWLLDHDANPYAADFEGKTPIERAEEGGFTEIVEMLRPFYKVDEA